MSNEVQNRESTQERISRLTPAQRAMLEKRLRGEGRPSQSQKSVIQRRPALDYSLTAEQEHLWLLQQVNPTAYYFNHTHAYLLKGELNVAALERAINEMVRRHENFRTSLPEVGGKPRAVVAPQLQLPIERVDVPEFREEDRRDRLQALITASTCRPFDILSGPLIRATLYRVNEGEHVIQVTLHHLVTDFVSYDLFDYEMFTLYDAFSRGLPSPLPELPVQYGDFAVWLNQWMQSEEAARQTDYWMGKLADLPRLDLVTDMPRPRFRSFDGERISWNVPESLWFQFKQVALTETVTRFTAFLALFAIFLREYSSSDDIPIATPVSSRKHRETQPLIGYFLNTIVYRLDLSGDPTFRELLQHTRVVTLESMANSDLPFEFLINKLAVERDPSRAPLVDSSYAFGNDHKPPSAPGGLILADFDTYYRSAWLDINFGVNDNTDHAIVALDYLTAIFLPSTGQRMMLHFQRLFAQAVADPNRRLSGFSLISDDERQQILREFNDTRTEYPRGTTMMELFAEQVQHRENEWAVVCDQQKLSYRELDYRSNQLGRYLRKLGVGPEKLVGISMDRSVDMVVAMLGALKAGGAYVPIDPAYPPDRLRYIVEDSGIQVLVTKGRQDDQMPELKAHAVCLDRNWNEIAQQSSDTLQSQMHPENLVYVIYTSGSTGQPKAIAVSHRSLIRLLRQTNYIQFESDDVVAQTANMSFDPATFEIWGALVNGCRLVIFNTDVLLDIERLATEIKDKGVKVLFLTTAWFNEVSRHNPAIFNSVKYLIFGGEVAHPGATASVVEHGGPEQLMNAYGPAECTTFSSFYVVRNVPANAASIPVGKPVANTQLYVLDRNMNLVPVGVMGQLYVGGEGVARGYWERPQLTAERFVPDPYGEAGGRLYVSGDLARWTEEGNLEFLGRADNQVKIRGFLVEPGEIEAVLLQHPRVRSCAVLTRTGPTGKRLAAYVTGEVKAKEIENFLKGKLPEYMVPGMYLILPELPLNEHGKVDRKALPAPEFIGMVSGREPSTPEEKALCLLMKQMLGVPHATPDDNFFSLGGDSILATQLVRGARQAGVIVSLRDVFEQPTIEALAAVSRPVQETTAAVADVGVGPMPATPIMCWFLESGGKLQRFSQSMVLQVPAGLKQDDLVRALQTLLDHHDALRLRFKGVEASREDWRLEVQEQGAVVAARCLQRVDVAGLEEDARRRQMEEEGEAAAGRLSAEKGEMLQAVWFDAGKKEGGQLLLTIHHLCVDGVSWRILLPDLVMAWAAIARGESPRLETCPVSFRGWAERLRQEAANPERVKELSFWSEMLNDPGDLAPGQELDRRRDTVGKAGQMVLTLPSSVTGPLLNRVAGAFHARINDVLLTGLALSLRKWKGGRSGGTSVLIDLEGHGREGIFDGLDLSRTVGFFTSLYPVRLDAGAVDVEEAWAGGKALGVALKTIKEQLRAVPDNGIGYGLLRYMNAETGAVLSGLVKPQIGFNYLGRLGVGEKEDWAPVESLSGGMDAETPLHHPLQIDAMVLERTGGPELTAMWTWGAGIFSEEEVRGLAEGWFEVLRALVRHSEEAGAGGLTPSDVPLVAVTQKDIERLELEYGEIEDLLPLSPVQEGMLFHAFYHAEGPDVYNIQILQSVEGDVDEELLQEAVKELLLRHKNLFAGFQHEELKRPVQIIPKEVRLPWRRLDLSGLEREERERKLDELVKQDRQTRFDPGTPPLFRFLLIHWAPSEFRLLITTHHIVIDGWSVALMISELRMLYERRAKYAGLPGVVPFRNYLAWLAGRDRNAAELAWREALAGLEEGTRISPASSLDDPKIPERKIVVLEEKLTQRLSEQARAHSLTLNTVIQGAWAVLLSRQTGRDDVVFGSTVSGRSPEIGGAETMIGLLINTVPTRVQLRSSDTFREVLDRLNLEQSRLFAHHYLGLAEIQRLTGMNELFDTLVVFENYPRTWETETEQPLSNGVRFTLTDLNDAAHYPLVVVVAPGRELGLYFTYRPDRFSAHAVEALTRRFARLLAAYADDPDQSVNTFNLLEEEECRQILLDWNNTAAAYPSTQTILGCFALQVAKAGNAIALRAPQMEVTYHDLNRRADRLAHRLIAAGVRAETAVAILMERSVDVIVAALAVLKAGGAYLPLHPAYPVDRMRLIMGEAGAAVLLLNRATADRGIVYPEIIVVDDEPSLIAEDVSDPEVLVNPDQLAYIMYTSGSTGAPKGVAVTHRNVVSLAFDRSWQEESLERVLFHSSPAFDASTFEMWAPLLRGKQVIIPPPGDLDIAVYRRLFQEEKATTTFFTSGLFNVLVQEAPDCFSGVPEIWAGGDVVPVAAVQRLHERCPGTLVCNGYGPTETTTFALHYAASAPGNLTASVPIGSPMDNHQVYVLDSFFNPVPAGVPGELFIAGDGVARGYLKRPDLTAERFMPNPFGHSGGRIYRTGDRVRWREDGQMEFLGRNDHQVKVRGYRIELAEIEAALTNCAGVGQAAVMVREDRAGERKLVAYVVPAPGHSISTVELRQSLAHKLPDYMVPAFITVLTSLPLNSNGKLDRKALPAPEVSGTGAPRAPHTQAEEVFCSLLQQLLGVPQVTPNNNFFSLGGDSILAIQLVSRSRKAGLIVTVRDVFQQPSIEALAAVARFAQQTAGAALDIGVGPMPPTPIMGWFLEHGGSFHRFSQSMLLQIPADLKHEHLVRALQAILDCHDALRLLFTGTGGSREQWKLQVQPKGAVSAALCLRVINIDGLDADMRQRTIEEEAQAVHMRLSAESGVMLQAVWFDAGRNSPGRLLLTIHHLAVDGVSWRILLPDLAACIPAISTGNMPMLEPCPVSFRGWAQRLNQEALNPERVKELSFWTNTLKDAPELLPGYKLDPARDRLGSVRQIALTLPASVTAPLLNRVAAAFHARINDVLLAGFVLSILNWCRRNSREDTSLLIDLEGHGREAIFEGLDLSRTVGFFTTIFPVRLDPGPLDLEEAWAGGKALGQVLKSIKEQLRAIPDNGIGYGLLRYLNPETSPVLSALPESQIDFNYLGRFPVAETGHWAPCESLTGSMDPDMPCHHPLEVNSMVLEHASGPELSATWTWVPTAFSEQDVRLLAEGWFHALKGLVQHCAESGIGGLTPSDVPLAALSQLEIDRLENEYGEIQDILPLSPVQEGMLFHAFYDVTGTDVYNVQVILTLEGPLDEKALHEAARALLRRHPNLRAAFKHQELARPVQILPHDVSLPFQALDFSALEAAECERSLAELVKKERLTRFQLDESPLFRLCLVCCSPQRFRLLITTHHILIDGWSLPLMLRELLLLYAHQGSPAPLPRVTPFRDYLEWLSRQDRKTSEAAWREALAGLEEGTRMSAAGSLREPGIPERIYVVLDEELTGRLAEQARARNLTLNIVIQGAWAALLSRYTGRDDVVFGSTVSGRSPEIPGIESMIGLLINTLPTRVQLRSSDSFNDLLGRLSQEHSRLLPHQYLGLLEIQHITGLNALFDTLVVFENFPMNGVTEQEVFGGVRLTELDTNDATHYPLSLLLRPGQGLTMAFEYQPDCFAGSFVDTLSRRFVRLLAACSGDPNQVVSCVDLLSEQERRQILVEFNQTHTEYPRGRTMMELFAEQVRRRGEEPAVMYGKEQLSYAELDRRSNQLGRYLKNLGVDPEKLVGVRTERSVEMVLAMVAILKAGGAYVPIDPAYPPERLRFMVEDSAIAVLLTQRRLAHQMPEIQTPIFCLDRDWDEIAQQSNQSFQNQVLPENLAYVIYTSGSTGIPKATAVSHRSMIRLLRETNYIQFQGDEVVAQTVNMSFDPSTFEIWGALLNGCRLVIIGNEVLLDVNRFAAEIKEKAVNVMFLATSLFNEVGLQNPSMFNSVKYLLFGGEAVHPGTAAAVLDHGGPERLVNAYGPAECTTFTSCYLAREVAADAASVPIGKPVSNTQVYVLDRHLNLEPVGFMGQLYIGGEGLARGYWRRPELTAERYVPNPYGPPGERMYCSGDLARWMEDGNLEFFGRADSQIKIRGFRVELGEIEVALLQHGGVRNCAVLMKTSASGKRLVAYISGEATAEELKNYLKAKLPEYMVPGVYVMLPELPLSTNGKVDRRALPDYERALPDCQDGAPETMTAIEELLVDIWTEVLGAARVRVRDNFYDLGGESLLALRVVSRINNYFQTELSVRTLLEHPVLMDLAQKLPSISGRSVAELEKIARIGLMVRRMTPEQRKAALAGQSRQ
jgi:amino acid adenylation domain-containing protein/non-ribosomal peptide synthase protein (TIGR01720 family)